MFKLFCVFFMLLLKLAAAQPTGEGEVTFYLYDPVTKESIIKYQALYPLPVTEVSFGNYTISGVEMRFKGPIVTNEPFDSSLLCLQNRYRETFDVNVRKKNDVNQWEEMTLHFSSLKERSDYFVALPFVKGEYTVTMMEIENLPAFNRHGYGHLDISCFFLKQMYPETCKCITVKTQKPYTYAVTDTIKFILEGDRNTTSNIGFCNKVLNYKIMKYNERESNARKQFYSDFCKSHTQTIGLDYGLIHSLNTVIKEPGTYSILLMSGEQIIESNYFRVE